MGLAFLPLRKSLKLKNIFSKNLQYKDANAPHRYTSALYVICRAYRNYFFSGMAPKFGLCPYILWGSLGYQRCLQLAHLFVPYYLKTNPKSRRHHHQQQQNRSFQIRKFSTRPKQNNEDDDRGPDDFLLDRVFLVIFFML